MRALYLDCFSGIAGDMFVGALLDLGASLDGVRDGLGSLDLDGYELSTQRVSRGPLDALKFDVVLTREEHVHRGLADVRAILESGSLPDRVFERALAAFTLLAEAEGKVHGAPPDKVHFHEVGAVDAICDVVGTCLALEDLAVKHVVTGPVHVGSGWVQCLHGTLPVPAPAVLNCLKGFELRMDKDRPELVTPTGACLLASLADSTTPPASFVVDRVGYGAGTRDPDDIPNALRAVLGEVPETGDEEPLVELSTNLDHLPPTVLAAALEGALAQGARDAFVIPCTMKKGRSGHLLVALVPVSRRESVEAAIFAETGTLGIRRHAIARTVLERRFDSVQTPWGPVRVKVGTYRGQETSRVPEFEDCRRLAQEHGVPVSQVLEAARAAAERGASGGGTG